MTAVESSGICSSTGILRSMGRWIFFVPIAFFWKAWLEGRTVRQIS